MLALPLSIVHRASGCWTSGGDLSALWGVSVSWCQWHLSPPATILLLLLFLYSSCVSADQWVIYIDGLDLIPAIQLASKNLSYLLGSICASLSWFLLGIVSRITYNKIISFCFSLIFFKITSVLLLSGYFQFKTKTSSKKISLYLC